MGEKEYLMGKLLYIFDDNVDDNNISKLAGRGVSDRIFLCPICMDRDLAKKLIERIKPAQSFEFQARFAKKAFELKDPFIDFIHCLGDKLKVYFKVPFKHFSVWWISLVAEKNTLKTDFYHNIVKLAVISDIISECSADEIWIDLKDSRLSAAVVSNFTDKIISNFNGKTENEFLTVLKIGIAGLRILLGTMIKSAYLKIVMRRKRPDGKYLFVTYFPLIDKECFKRGEFINKYYEPLQKALKKKGEKYSWLAINSKIDGFSWKEGVKIGSSVASFGENITFHEQWLGPMDFIYAFFSFFVIGVKYLLKRRSIAAGLLFFHPKINLWQIYNREWDSSFFGPELTEGLLFYLAFRNVFRQTSHNMTVIYYMENYVWEKALNIAASEAGKLITIGVQHSTIPLLSLNYFESAKDLIGRDNIKNMPRSAYLACVGKITLGMFKNQGWKDTELLVLGGLRYKYLHNLMGNKIEWSKRRDRVVVALTIDPSESKEILYYVYNAFKDYKGEYEILVKNHYVGRPISELLSELTISHEGIFNIVTMPLSELLPSAKILITGGSTAAVEGLASQCAVIIPRLVSVVDLCPLSHITNMIEYAENPGELKIKVEKTIIKNESPYSFEECRKFVSDYFDILSSDEEYLSRLEGIMFNV